MIHLTRRVVRRLSSLVLSVLYALFLSCCTLLVPGAGTGTSLSVLTYNVENLFDDKVDGNEYPEFDPSEGGWTTAAYQRKLANIAEVIRSSERGAPDIVALQEIEGLAVLEDLRASYLSGCGYSFAVAAVDPELPVKVGFLSRLPFQSVSAHRFQTAGGPGRSVLEISVSFEGEIVTILNCHWKSKRGGAEETELERIAYASLVASRLERLTEDDPGACVMVVGDLNERPDEYELVGGSYLTALLPADLYPAYGGAARHLFIAPLPRPGAPPQPAAVLFSPWFSSEAEGSYVYRGVWERIDHVLVSAGLVDGQGVNFRSFEVVRSSFMLDSYGYPLRFSRRSMTGYSDHLPLLVRLGSGGSPADWGG